jgi:inner membrane protein
MRLPSPSTILSRGMPTVFTHPAVALGLAPFFRHRGLTRQAIALGVLCTAVADFDVLGFRFGVPYGSLLGHRGLTHSPAFALVLGVGAAALARRFGEQASPRVLASYFILCAASHGFLDAFTDGGLGVAFLSPFSNARTFFPWTPIRVSPIGLESFVRSGEAWAVLSSELVWVVLPSLAFGALGLVWSRASAGRAGR